MRDLVNEAATDPQDARRFYLNQITHASDSYVSHPEWEGCKDEEASRKPGDTIEPIGPGYGAIDLSSPIYACPPSSRNTGQALRHAPHRMQ